MAKYTNKLVGSVFLIIGIFGIFSFPFTLVIDKRNTESCVIGIKLKLDKYNINDESIANNLKLISSNNLSFKKAHATRGAIIVFGSIVMILTGVMIFIKKIK